MKAAKLIQPNAHRRITNQRQIIAECLASLNHPTVEEIQICVSGIAPSINKATIYRTMNRMVEDGDIRRLVGQDGVYRYDTNNDRHFHICCEKCGALSDIHMPVLPPIDQDLPSECGFELTGYDIIFKGICPACREREQDEPDDDTLSG